MEFPSRWPHRTNETNELRNLRFQEISRVRGHGPQHKKFYNILIVVLFCLFSFMLVVLGPFHYFCLNSGGQNLPRVLFWTQMEPNPIFFKIVIFFVSFTSNLIYIYTYIYIYIYILGPISLIKINFSWSKHYHSLSHTYISSLDTSPNRPGRGRARPGPGDSSLQTRDSSWSTRDSSWPTKF